MNPDLEAAIQRHLEYTDATRRAAALNDLYDACAPHCRTERDWQDLADYILTRRRDWERARDTRPSTGVGEQPELRA